MSFRCDFCGEAQGSGVTPIRVVTKIRHKGSGGYEWKGTEIAEEKSSCASCHNPEFEPQVITTNPAANAVANPVLTKSL